MATDRKEYLRLFTEQKVYGADALKILLCNAFGERAAEIAEALCERFPGPLSVVEADYAELMSVKGMTREIASYIKCIHALLKQTGYSERRIAGAEQLKRLVCERIGQAENEVMEFYFTDNAGRIKEIRTFSSERINRVEASLRDVLPSILADGVKKVYLAHNHVGCAATPSQQDDVTTKKLKYVCGVFGVELVDHCITGGNATFFSYRNSGRLDK